MALVPNMLIWEIVDLKNGVNGWINIAPKLAAKEINHNLLSPPLPNLPKTHVLPFQTINYHNVKNGSERAGANMIS